METAGVLALTLARGREGRRGSAQQTRGGEERPGGVWRGLKWNGEWREHWVWGRAACALCVVSVDCWGGGEGVNEPERVGSRS